MVTKARIILGTFTFYIAIGVIFSLIGQGAIETTIDPSFEDPSLLSALDGLTFFFQAFTFTVSAFPFFVNVLLFAPLAITLFYILIDTIIPG